MQSGGWRNPTPGRGPGSLQLRRAAGAGCSGAQVGGAARGARARVVGWEPERKGALQPREPPPPPTGERETAGGARGHPQPGVAAARTPGSGRRARKIGQVGKVALGSTVGFLGGKWRQPGSAGKILTPAFATGLTRSVLSSNPGTVPPPLFRPPASCAPVFLILSSQVPSTFMLSISASFLPAAFNWCGLFVLTPQTPSCGLLPKRTNPLGTLELTCPRLSPTSHQLPGLFLCLFPSRATKMFSTSQTWVAPYPGNFPFDLSCASLHQLSSFHFPRPDLHLLSLPQFRKCLPAFQIQALLPQSPPQLLTIIFLPDLNTFSCISPAGKLSAFFFPYQILTFYGTC